MPLCSCAKVRTVQVLRRLLPLVILVLPAFLLTANPAPMANEIDALEGGAKLQAVIDRVVERQRGVRTLQADFVQLKHSELLLEAVESSGVFLFRAPDLVRWDYLRPVTSMLKKRLRSVEIEIDRALFLPVVVEYNEADGDSTRYEFNNLVINSPIDDSRFRLDLGVGVRLQTLDASSGVG